MRNFDRIITVYSAAWLDGDINAADLFPLQIQLLHERLRNETGRFYSDEEIRLSWRSFFQAKYPSAEKRDLGFDTITLLD
jgi:hypothetical protein